MKYTFKYPRRLGPTLFSKGTHEVPLEFTKKSFFQTLLKAGDITPFVEPAPPKKLIPSADTVAKSKAALAAVVEQEEKEAKAEAEKTEVETSKSKVNRNHKAS